MSDLVMRLRESRGCGIGDTPHVRAYAPLLTEAADEIERLRIEVADARWFVNSIGAITRTNMPGAKVRMDMDTLRAKVDAVCRALSERDEAADTIERLQRNYTELSERNPMSHHDATVTGLTHNHYIECQSCKRLRQERDAAVALLRECREELAARLTIECEAWAHPLISRLDAALPATRQNVSD